MSFIGDFARILAIFVLVCGVSATKSKPHPKPHKQKAAVTSQMDNDWPKTFALIKNHSDPVAAKLLTWIYVVETPLPVEPRQLLDFIKENPGWPKLYLFRNKIEHNVASWKDAPALVQWFDQNPPQTFDGMKAYMEALLRTNHAAKARTALSTFWLNAQLNKNETAALAGTYKQYFGASDHFARLDNLLWQGRNAEAEYMLAFVGADTRAMGQARIALSKLAPTADKLVAEVPASLQKNEGFLFDRLKARRRRNNDTGALEILAQMPAKAAHPEAWWGEQNILARRRLEARDYTGAYKIIRKHQLTEGYEFAQAEWTMGWISLRNLNDPMDAYKHFDGMYRKVSTAISLSRGAYWAARAAEALPDHVLAQQWDKVAAQYPSTFYGQLSYEKIYGDPSASTFADPAVPADVKAKFNKNELVRVVRILDSLSLKRLIDPFLARLNADAKTSADYTLVASLARETGRYYYAVQANKDCQQQLGKFLFNEGYPALPSVPLASPEKALVHAIIHRESMFNADAASPVGARGLMQLMPATAKVISKRAGRVYDLGKLTTDPNYNVLLGETYLGHLVDDYGGFYPMAIAAYNAGPGNVQDWIETYGDPRIKGNMNIVDWVEHIPIYETRNYVQRVMESYYIYRLRFGQAPKTILDFQPH